MKGKSLAKYASTLLLLVIATSIYVQRDTLSKTPTTLNPEELEPLETSSITVNIQHVTNQTSLRIYVRNNSTSKMSFGVDYAFYKLENGVWKSFPSETTWISLLIEMQPGGTYHQTANITGFITGKYRVTKELQIEGAKKTEGAEFIVERPPIDPDGVPKYGYYLMVNSVAEQSLYSKAPYIELYNHGGLTLTLPSEFHYYQMVNGEWVEVAGNPGGGPSVTLAPGGTYFEHLDVSSIHHSMKYVRPVYVEGYNKPVQFVFELTGPS